MTTTSTHTPSIKNAIVPVTTGIKAAIAGISYGFGIASSAGEHMKRTNNSTVRYFVDNKVSDIAKEAYSTGVENGADSIEWTVDSINKAIEESREFFSSDSSNRKDNKPAGKGIAY